VRVVLQPKGFLRVCGFPSDRRQDLGTRFGVALRFVPLTFAAKRQTTILLFLSTPYAVVARPDLLETPFTPNEYRGATIRQ